MAHVHLGVLTSDPRVRLVAVHDVLPEKAAAVAERFQVPRIYTSYADVLADDALDLVLVLLPHDLHFRYSLDALQAGKHVVCEKPLTTSVPDAKQLLAAAERTGRYLFPVHNRVYDEATERASQLLTSGALGEIFLAQTEGFEGPRTVSVRPWLATAQGGGGVLLAQAVHPAYLLRYLVGDVASVACFFGRRRRVEMTHEDTAVVALEFRSGAVGNMTATFGVTAGPLDHVVTLFGTDGWVQFRMAPPGRPGQVLRAIAPRLYGDDAVHEEYFPERQGFRRMWDDYLNAILTGTQPCVTALDGAKAVEIIAAAYQSQAEGCAVRLEA
jgi:predicted dehydrogenase